MCNRPKVKSVLREWVDREVANTQESSQQAVAKFEEQQNEERINRMTKCKPVSVRESWVLNPQGHRVPPEVGVVLLVISAIALGSCLAIAIIRKAHAEPQNQVMIPSYGIAEGGIDQAAADDRPQAKYQYKATDEEKPILHKKTQQKEVGGGAKYEAGDDLVVEPESDDFDTTDEPIIESESNDTSTEPVVSPAPEIAPAPSAVMSEVRPHRGMTTAEAR